MFWRCTKDIKESLNWHGKGSFMNRKMIYVLSWAGFFLMWGLFGFVAAAPRGEPARPAIVPSVKNTAVIPAATALAGIPVTGKSEPVWSEILGFYGLIGFAALFLILALLSFANKATALYPKPNSPPSEETHKH
jgi:hypothetical protein